MESNLVCCKICKELKIKTEAGFYPKGKIKKYIDQFNRQWNGKICPECNRSRVKNVMKAMRLKCNE